MKNKNYKLKKEVESLRRQIKFFKDKTKKRKKRVTKPKILFTDDIQKFLDDIKNKKLKRERKIIDTKNKRVTRFKNTKLSDFDKSQLILTNLYKKSFTKEKNIFSKKKYYRNIKRKFKIKTTTDVVNFINGKFSESQIKKIRKLTKNHSIKKVSFKNFTVDSFNKENFNPLTKVYKKFKDEAYLFKAGLEIFIKSEGSSEKIIFEGKEVPVWKISNYPISEIYFDTFKKSEEKFYKKIKYETEKLKSILFFKVNYFTVHVINGSTHEIIL